MSEGAEGGRPVVARPVLVRPLEPRDAAAWSALFRAYGEFYDTTFDESVLERVWAQLLAAGSGIDGLVAERLPDDGDGAVIGLAHYRSHPDTFTGGRDWYLDDLYVAPEARGGGTGTALIRGVAALASEQSGGTLRWITAESNERARQVYERIAVRTSWVTYEMTL
ncbi:MAG: GNAT family N-acetyltransferase [Microbacteriaceae bacterium]